MSHDHIDPVSLYVKNFIVLVVLLFVTVGVAYIDLPLKSLNIIVAMLIACLKGVLVVIYFMGIRKTTKLTQVWAYGGLIFLLTLFSISLSDYFSR